MKKIRDIRAGDWMTYEQMKELFPFIAKKTFYGWKTKHRKEPNKYPRVEKIGGIAVVSKHSLLECLNSSVDESAA